MIDHPTLNAVRRILAKLPHAREQGLAALNGALGDRLHEWDESLAPPMELFVRTPEPHRGFAPVDTENLAMQASGGHLVLLVHGLMGSPHAWTVGSRGASSGAVDFGEALAEQIGITPMYLRYNSGRHISHNGRQLADRLEQLMAQWPKSVERLDILAHSMGGLVGRSALHYGLEAGHRWPSRVGRVVMLGTPSHGAPLEQIAHTTAFTLETIWNPWTKLIGKAINLRSIGIKDLRHGFCVDEDWQHKDQDELRLQKPRPTRSPPGIKWFVAAGTTGRPDHWVSKIVGDGIVRGRSVEGRGFGTAQPGVLPKATIRVFGHTGHNALLNSPAVFEQVRQWLGDSP